MDGRRETLNATLCTLPIHVNEIESTRICMKTAGRRVPLRVVAYIERKKKKRHDDDDDDSDGFGRSHSRKINSRARL